MQGCSPSISEHRFEYISPSFCAQKKSFISFRDSTLTHILKDSLGGNTKTTLIVACSPHIFNRDETISTLRFATRCRMIANTVFKNTVLSPQQMTKLIQNLKEEIVDLKQKLQDKVIQEMKTPDTDDNDETKTSEFASERMAMNLDPAVQKQMIDDLKNYKSENIKLQQEQDKSKQREEELLKQIADLQSDILDWKEVCYLIFCEGVLRWCHVFVACNCCDL